MYNFASNVFPAKNNQESAYHERTCRNHFWLNSTEGQQKIRNMKIAVAGLGGMGSNIAETLVRLGVGHLRIADPDHIERSNINRQVIANQDTLKQGKARISATELRKIAEDFELVVYEQGVQEDMVDEFVSGCDAIVDEIDIFPLNKHVALHRAARKKNIPIYSAYVVGMGIHFYKFVGDKYKFEDFLENNENDWEKPTPNYLFKIFGSPMPDYLNQQDKKDYLNEIKKNGAPIFGPATLMGHSLVVTRLFLDLFQHARGANNHKTPVMPEFLVLDPREMSFTKEKVKRFFEVKNQTPMAA